MSTSAPDTQLRAGPAADAAVAPPTRKRRRWLRRLAATALVVAAVVTAAWLWVVPVLVERALRRALADAGFQSVQLRLAALSHDRVVLADVALGAPRSLRAARVTARFSPRELLAGRVGELVVHGAVWNPAAGVPWSAPRSGRSAPSATAVPAVLPELPFSRLELRACRIRAQNAGFERVDLDASLVVDAAGGWRARAAARSAGQVLNVALDLDPGDAAASGPAHVELGGERRLKLDGHARLQRGEGRRALDLDLRSSGDGFDLRAPGGVAVEGHGVLQLQAAVPLSRPDGALRVVLDGVTCASGEAFEVEGLAGTIDLRGLTSAAAGRDQRLRWDRFRAGELHAGAGVVDFALAAGPVLEVRRSRWATGTQGALATGAFRVEPGMRSLATTLSLEAVPLDDWLALVSDGRVTGTGRVDGELRVRVQLEPRLDVELGRGSLRTAGSGVVRFLEDAETQALVEQQVARIAQASGKHDEVVRDRLVTTLQEFAYRELRFDLVPDDDDLTLRVHAAGKGVRVPQELDLDVNFHGFDRLVDLALDVKLGLDRAREQARRALGEPRRRGDNP